VQEDERHEVERILRALSARVGEEEAALLGSISQAAALDAIFARAGLSLALNCVAPTIEPQQRLYLPAARHPLLPEETVVPIDLRLGEEFTALLITGPNTGGKTVALKTLGVMALMAQSGLHLPCAPGARLPVFDQVLADIGEEQSLEQSLSTFSSHIKNIIRLSSLATQRSLVLLDEVGAGTDPEEGALLGIALLEHFRERGCLLAASTHHSQLKAFAWSEPGFCNASVEFDPETLAPTYRLRLGVPGASNALAIAKRLGLDDSLVRRAESLKSAGQASLQEMILDLHALRDSLERERSLLEQRARALTQEIEEAKRLRQEWEQRRRAALAEGYREARAVVQRARAEADEVLRLLRQQQHESRETQALRTQLTHLSEELAGEEGHPLIGPEPPPAVEGPIGPGDTVWVARFHCQGTVLAVAGEKQQVTVEMGALRATVPLAEVAKIEAAPRIVSPPAALAGKAFSTRPEIDLHGQTVDEALQVLEKYLDDASLAGLPSVRIVHGIGTGALRRAVQQMLRHHPLVRSFRPGTPEEGGPGVTVALL